jgi:hypothetical protein
MELTARIGWWIGLSGIFLVVAAVVCESTGTRARIAGHVVNTHVTATWVLACLGLVLLGNGLALLAFGNARKAGGLQDDTAPGRGTDERDGP